MALHGRGTCTVCGSRSTLTPLQIKQANIALTIETVRAVALRYGVHDAAMRRHKINHLHRPLLSPVMITDEVGLLDTTDALVNAFFDAERIRQGAVARGAHGVALSAVRTMQAVARQLHAELGVEPSVLQGHLAEVRALRQAVTGSIRQHPGVARSLAEHTDDDDLRRDLDDLYERALAAQTKEPLSA